MHNEALDSMSVQDLPLPGGLRILLITRAGSAIVPEGDTALTLQDRLTLAGEESALAEARALFAGEDAG